MLLTSIRKGGSQSEGNTESIQKLDASAAIVQLPFEGYVGRDTARGAVQGGDGKEPLGSR